MEEESIPRRKEIWCENFSHMVPFIEKMLHFDWLQPRGQSQKTSRTF
jgi:hypothetical protein